MHASLWWALRGCGTNEGVYYNSATLIGALGALGAPK